MALVSSNLLFVVSGNTNSASGDCLGGNSYYTSSGERSSVGSSKHALFDEITIGRANTGEIQYVCIGLLNSNTSSKAENVRVWINADSTSPDTSIQLALGVSGVVAGASASGTTVIEPRIANRFAAPANVTFTNAIGSNNSLLLGTIPPEYSRMFWIKRTVNAGAAQFTGDGFTLSVATATA